MEAIRQYALSLLCGAMILGLLLDLSEKAGFSKQLRLVGSIFLTGLMLSPLVKLQLGSLPSISGVYQSQAEAAAAQGEEIRIRSLRSLIRGECEAYILKEAEAIGADVEVEITLSMDDPPVPQTATLRGSFDADAEIRLSELLSEELGIPKEHQTWIRRQSHSSDSSSANTSIVS